MSYYTSTTTPLPYGTYNPIRSIPVIAERTEVVGKPLEQEEPALGAQLDHQPQLDLLSQPLHPSPESKDIKKERKNRPGQKFGAKKKSWVWSWFVQDSANSNVAACDYCGKIIVRLASDKGLPKKLSEHLKTHKLTKDTVNYSRTAPVDGYGVTYTTNGEPISYPTNFVGSTTAPAPPPPEPGIDDKKKHKKFKPNDAGVTLPQYIASNRRFLSTEFDNSPYSAMKFHKHLMKFLTENKLPIGVIKSHSFQQIIYDFRSDSVADLLELTNLYSSLLEVSRYSDALDSTDAEHQAVHALANVVEKRMTGGD